MNSFYLHVAGAEEIVHPRRLTGRFWRPFTFSVRARGGDN